MVIPFFDATSNASKQTSAIPSFNAGLIAVKLNQETSRKTLSQSIIPLLSSEKEECARSYTMLPFKSAPRSK